MGERVKMYKELIIITFVILLIVGIDIITGNYTRDSVQIMSSKLNELRGYILEENKEEATNKMQAIKENWEERYKVLAFYIEHDELEKVEIELTELSAFLSVMEYDECICNIDSTIFILEHIQEKEEFHLRSIF